MRKSTNAGVFSPPSRTLVLLLGAFLLFFGLRACLKSGLHAYTRGGTTPGAPRHSAPEGTGGAGVAVLALKKAPPHVRRMIEHLRNAPRLRPLRGYRGGRVFRNREGLLPKGKTYYEFDVHPITGSASRGAERLVTDQNRRLFYYTRDHYRTFTKIE